MEGLAIVNEYFTLELWSSTILNTNTAGHIRQNKEQNPIGYNERKFQIDFVFTSTTP